MAHKTLKSTYQSLEERINRFPLGAAPSDLLHKILALLMSEKEAGLVSLLPIKPFTVKQASQLWKLDENVTLKILDSLADRALILDLPKEGQETRYVLPPPMAGFFEFSLMRIRGDIDQKYLSELYDEYITRQDDFLKGLFAGGEMQLGRTYVNEDALPENDNLLVLDYERSSHLIKTASHVGVGMCYCRHKKQHLGTACDAPMDICMTLNSTADSLIRHGHARRVDNMEALDLLQLARDKGLVQFGENAQENISFICHCCGCCCEALHAVKKFGSLNPIHTTNFILSVEDSACTGCGACVRACPVEALSLVNSEQGRKKAVLDGSTCLGCGVCVKSCPRKSLKLVPRKLRVMTPVNSAYRIVLMALERGKLQHLIFDTPALVSHRVMGNILGALLKLTPSLRLKASRQLQSRYIESMFAKIKN